MASAPSVPADCQLCGACCFGDGPRYLHVDGDDHARLGDAADRLTTFIGNRCYLRLVERRCTALVVTGDHYRCEVYEHRPKPCRQLERGSAECVAVLERERGRLSSDDTALS